jgi:serine protease Do
MKIRTLAVSGALLFALTSSLLGAQQIIWGGSGGYLGVSLRDVTSEDAMSLGLKRETGVFIQEVVADSPAADAGIQEGDVVLEFSGLPILNVRQFQRIVSETPPGRDVDMVVWRTGGKINLTAEIGKKDGPFKLGRVLSPEDFKQEYHFEAKPELDDFIMRVEPGLHGFTFSRGLQLGINATRLTPQMADFLGVSDQKGALILEVRKGTPAEKAELKAGDVITSFDGKTVESPADLRGQLSRGDHEIEFIRNGAKQKATVTLNPEKPKNHSESSQTLRM